MESIGVFFLFWKMNLVPFQGGIDMLLQYDRQRLNMIKNIFTAVSQVAEVFNKFKILLEEQLKSDL
ncbi:hypothetical protein T06_6356 [Trichinella sp. T6]|nr:hypothetical protein T06_6356 [Trichinella sp. T6]